MSSPKVGEVILPKPGQKNLLITSALPYVNNVPHLGNIIGCVLSGDVYARYARLRGYNCIYICGTDEYGTATETKALQMKCTPQEICDKYHKIHAEIYEWFNIGFDKFGRTSTQSQTEIAQDIFNKCHKNGYTQSQEMEQLFCDHCKMFLADRFVEGTCPNCQYPDSRGDQCDKCSKLLNPEELLNPRCSICRNTPHLKSTKHIFLDLPQLQERVNTFVDTNSAKGAWSDNSIHITNTWVKGELKPRCITRDLKWGTPVPLEEYKDKVFYVWFDAPIGYLSITKEYTPEWEKWWKNPEQVELVQFMGKDNVPFHTVIFPASLIGTHDNYTMLKTLSTTEFLNYETGKFSKSRNTGIFGDGAKSTGIPADVFRFYLLSNRPEQSDSIFSWDDFNAKNNELLNNYGNLINRVLKYIDNKYNRVLPAIGVITEGDEQFIKEINKLLFDYFENMEAIKIKEGLKIAMSISARCNAYMQTNKAWDYPVTDPRSGTILNILINCIKMLATIFEPFTPLLSNQIHQQLAVDPTPFSTVFEFLIKPGHEISNNITPLIQRIDGNNLKEYRQRFSGVGPEFPIDCKIAQVKQVDNHPTAENLYLLQLDIGNGVTKTSVAGLKGSYPDPSELKDKKLAVVLNLKPSKFKGVLSEAMVVVADDGAGNVSVLSPPQDEISNVQVGSTIAGKGMTIQPKASIDYQKEFLHYELKLENSKVFYKNTELLIAQKVSLTTSRSTPINAKLK
ncbi:methionyl-tRNA synthetase [Tieghemostelium lacteum]|uniref:methionine--tRNA ligase n=1 Tax=Tieghemostelium lacteum TaxID=361077 RepID=A0A151ZAD9_TIELA|nr:methionyl-tRNA synthetase [Tieghemostelium lacteum]|eukprot:KYQ90893.1 methionyl-tRNA synthetase [Tieghemostelium lacteum]